MAISIDAINAERLLDTFLSMVRIDSPSGEEGELRAWLENWFEVLGLRAETDAAGNLIVDVPGTATDCPTLIMTGHMDVVPPCRGVTPILEGTAEHIVIRSSGNTVLGADDKSGLAPMMEALTLSLAHDLPRPNLLFLITTREEVMLSGAKEMDPALYRHADFAIALDHTGEQGTVIYEAPSYYKFTIQVTGKSVHAGIMPERGVNAIQWLGKALAELPFGRLDDETTCNLGFIRGGKATNIVPDLAIVEGELRGHNEDRLMAHLVRMRQSVENTLAMAEGTTVTMTTEACFHHYWTDPAGAKVSRVTEAIRDAELAPNLIRTNGGSDVNVFAKNGVPGVVLSAGYIAPHSLEEQVSLRDMMTCTRLILSIWERFARP